MQRCSGGVMQDTGANSAFGGGGKSNLKFVVDAHASLAYCIVLYMYIGDTSTRDTNFHLRIARHNLEDSQQIILPIHDFNPGLKNNSLSRTCI